MGKLSKIIGIYLNYRMKKPPLGCMASINASNLLAMIQLRGKYPVN